MVSFDFRKGNKDVESFSEMRKKSPNKLEKFQVSPEWPKNVLNHLSYRTLWLVAPDEIYAL